ncbi:acylphosphatase [Marinobacterium aestuariivivens]|uniref:acylphosphatase n=1 Tax=Marinobacterium aestuariivivens TaxID=1698799 RepID=A0ABW2A821_9GAMM
MTTIAVEVRLSGRVQGVSFRHYTRQQALLEGLQGWVCNCSDGTVAAWIQGEAEAVARMQRWLEEGRRRPRSAICVPNPGRRTRT